MHFLQQKWATLCIEVTMKKDEKYNRKLLVKELSYGNEKAFHKLFDAYRKDVFFYSLSLLKCETYADEIVQEVFIKVWLRRNSLDSSLSFKSYLMTITKSTTLNFLKKAANDEKLREAIFYRSQKSYNPIYDQIRDKELEVIKQNAIDLLPPKRRLIYEMARNEGMSYDDISQELGISKNTVKSQMRKALETIRNFLIDQPDIILTLLILALEWTG